MLILFYFSSAYISMLNFLPTKKSKVQIQSPNSFSLSVVSYYDAYLSKGDTIEMSLYIIIQASTVYTAY